ncbi:biotin transporter BioY [Halobacillus naozhouensis]|uniref:Biotin transporter n=1 Tax=Halobacillus naozhouensis TaxID=554880 RepID=A0ABY8J1D7_9BACI|nr:biotin transporter BioY [Halobacillus naozhouensis]WFT74706.1 biotin transporter BioY [Halobacillus naozhouensis]
MNEQSRKLRVLINSSIFAAITAILAQFEIPLPLVPISGQTLAVGITATVLGSRQGATAMICYAAIGAVGIPVFAGFSGGLQVLAGPTGGYIVGFIAAAYITGFLLEKTTFTIPMALAANTLGMIIILIFGAVQLKFVAGLGWEGALNAGVYPFIAVGIIKAFLASWIGITIRKRLIQASLLSTSDKKSA